MPLLLKIEDSYGSIPNTLPEVITLEISDDADLLAGATNHGYQTLIPDPQFAEELDALVIEFHSLPSGSPERAAKGAEVQAFQAAGAVPIPNPESPSQFLVGSIMNDLTGSLINETDAREAAQVAMESNLASQRANANSKVIITKPPGNPNA